MILEWENCDGNWLESEQEKLRQREIIRYQVRILYWASYKQIDLHVWEMLGSTRDIDNNSFIVE